MTKIALFTPEEIAAGPDRTPTVEHRLNGLKQIVGLFMLVSRGLERADDLCMGREQMNEAFTQLSELSDAAWEHLTALEAVLQPPVLFERAPTVDGSAS